MHPPARLLRLAQGSASGAVHVGKRENDPETVWKIMKKVGVAMVAPHRDGEFEGRPLQAFP